ncbi:MAG: hypothetical protein ACK4UO_19775 [Pseudolabrys sp.]
MMMRTLMAGFALVAVTAAPALAASWNAPTHNRSAYVEPGYDAYAAAPMMEAPVVGMASPPVFAYGDYQGNDPDPFIRQQLMRDGPATASQY